MKVAKFAKVIRPAVPAVVQSTVSVEMTLEQATLLFQLYGAMLGGLSGRFHFLNDLREVAGGRAAWGAAKSPFYDWGVDNTRGAK